MAEAAATGGVRLGTAQGRWVLAATIAGSGLAMLDGTIVNIALAKIGTDLDASFAALQWITNAYTLTLAALILLGGSLGDLFGRRRIFVIGTVWFVLASLLCAISPNEQILIAARALQGIGAALLTPGSLAIISASFAGADRSRAIGAWSGLGGIAGAVGPFLGGWLVEIDWRWVFLINIPVGALVVWLAWRHVPETRAENRSTHLDPWGIASVVVALGGVTYALTTAGEHGWDARSAGSLAVGLAAAAVFLYAERRGKHPVVPFTALTDRVFWVTNAVTLFVYAALSVLFFLLVLQLQLVSEWSPLKAGTALLPVTALMLVLSARTGGLSDRTGPRPLMTLGTLLAATGFALCLRVGETATYVDVLVPVAFVGLGLSFTVAPLTATVLASAPNDLAGIASGINNAIARSAGLLAIAVVPAVAGLSTAGTGDGDAFDDGFRTAMLIGMSLMIGAAVLSWFALRDRRRTPVGRTDDVAVHQCSHCGANAPQLSPTAYEG